MIYFFTFGISTLTSLLSEILIRESPLGRRDVRACFFAALTVFEVGILSGIRDYSIGTDIQVYGNQVFSYAVQSHSITKFLNLCVNDIGMTEKGYALLNYIVAIFSSNPHFLYFILGLLTNGLIYYGLLRLHNVCSISIAWLTYLLVFYASTLNLLRQSLAIAIIFVMCTYAFSRRYVTSICLIVVAYSFHHSAIVGIYLLFFIWLFQREKTEYRNLPLMLLFSFLTALMPVAISWLNSAGYMEDKYSQYVINISSPISLLNSILIRIPFVIMALFLIVKHSRIPALKQSIYIFIIGEMLLLPLQLVSATAFRISLYFGIFKIVAYPSILKEIRTINIGKHIVYVAYLLFYFVWQIIIQGSNEVFPFIIANDLSII
ncbi:MAG: EpsG family protein [Bifidobacterium longum]|nr:EpsG family protein [Bifidobacterium longum]MDU3567387.1 EpsG family protein [Bifidobacterium longum]